VASRARLVLFAALLLAPALAGCNFRDWYNQEGHFRVFLFPQGPQNSSLSDFTTLTLAVYGVTVKQVQYIEPKTFTFGTQPLVIDMIKAGAKGELIPLTPSFLANIRPIESTTLTVDIVQAIDAQGRSIPVCREDQPTTTFPCFFLAKNGAITFNERPIAMQRGGTVNFGFPVAVKSTDQLFPGENRPTEYLLLSDQSLAIIDVDR
jgi:hypothetical protein